MREQQILEKAIKKAHANGFPGTVEQMHIMQEWGMTDHLPILGTLIVDHRFAKALWGDVLIQLARGNNIGQTITYHAPAWQVRLQDMVISDDPIKYLGDNL